MAKVKYEVCAADKRQDKTYWRKIGVILQTDKGFSLKLEAVPVAWDGWASLFEPKPKDEPRKDATRDLSDMKDDIPWQP